MSSYGINCCEFLPATTLFNFNKDGCPEYGCLLELTILLAVVMIGRQTVSNIREVVFPAIQEFRNRRSAKFLKRRSSIADVSSFIMYV